MGMKCSFLSKETEHLQGGLKSPMKVREDPVVVVDPQPQNPWSMPVGKRAESGIPDTEGREPPGRGAE
jgi:hypothetical protein